MISYISEKLLRVLSTSKASQHSLGSEKSVEKETASLKRVLPEIGSMLQGRRVLDFGCGTGVHAVGLALEGAAHVVGVDINDAFLQTGKKLAAQHSVANQVTFVNGRETLAERFDLVLSYNSMEHFSDPLHVLNLMKGYLTPDGRILLAFSPPWLSAYGAHMHFFTSVPWVHLIFPEPVVMRVRANYKFDGAQRYEEVEGGLNRMTVSKFESLVHRAGLRFEWIRLTPMRGAPLVTRVPGIRELFTTRVSCCLRIDPAANR